MRFNFIVLFVAWVSAFKLLGREFHLPLTEFRGFWFKIRKSAHTTRTDSGAACAIAKLSVSNYTNVKMSHIIVTFSPLILIFSEIHNYFYTIQTISETINYTYLAVVGILVNV